MPFALLRLLILIFCFSLPASGQEIERKVSGRAELQAALSQMKGGVIFLSPGHYGDLILNNIRYEETVTLRSDVPREAVFGTIRLKGVENISFDSLSTVDQFRVEKSVAVSISNCRANDMLYFRNVKDLTIDNCMVTGGQYGILFNSVNNFSLTHSLLGSVSEDIMRITGNSKDGLIEGNILDDVVSYPPTHPDIIQMFGARGKTPQRLIIRRNFMRDVHETGSPKRTAQGIFVAGPGSDGYRDITIEENIITTRSPNTIYIHAGQKNVIVRNNTLLPGGWGGGAIIRVVGKIDGKNSGTTISGNIAKLVIDESKNARQKKNYLYGRDIKITGIFSGTGKQWQDFLPVLGAATDKPDLGATAFLRELLEAQKPGAVGGPRLGPDWTD